MSVEFENELDFFTTRLANLQNDAKLKSAMKGEEKMVENRAIPDDFYKLLKKAAKEDLRIGQLFCNLNSEIELKGKSMFYIENNELVDYLKKYINQEK